ncbi:MAG TPA: DUF1826 domain-containing protein [Polyangiaceae bacterium]|nr:DUF1826 domain-containing protein [Polyangiaceae bacterium]
MASPLLARSPRPPSRPAPAARFASLPRAVRPGASHRTGRGPEVLLEARRPGVNVVVWRRPLGAWLGRRLEPLCRGLGVAFDGPTSARRPDAERLVSALPPSPARDALADDLCALVERFAALSGVERPHAHLEALDDDGCRRFHCDYVGLRLLTTYFGPGTEWLPDDAVDREALAPSELPPDEANAAIVLDRASVRRARPGDVIVLKGEGWPGNAGRGAVHRSPALAADGGRRLVFKLTALGRTP